MTVTDSAPLGSIQPDDAPETADCQRCGRRDQSARMLYAGFSQWYCTDIPACERRWLEERSAPAASAEQPETDADTEPEPQDDDAETDAGEADSPAGEPETATEDEGTSDDAGAPETAQDAE